MTAPLLTEVAWQEQVIELAHMLGWEHCHVRRSIGKGRRWTTATNVVGWPDLVLWNQRQRRLIFVELKTDVGRVTAEQVRVIESLRAAGQEAHVFRPSDLAELHSTLTRQAVAS